MRSDAFVTIRSMENGLTFRGRLRFETDDSLERERIDNRKNRQLLYKITVILLGNLFLIDLVFIPQ